MAISRAINPLILVAALTLLLGWFVSRREPPGPALPVQPQFSIDVNSATQRELESLPSIGPSAAKAIVKSRTEHGPFRDIADLDRVPGIGPTTIEQLAELLRAENPGACVLPPSDDHEAVSARDPVTVIE